MRVLRELMALSRRKPGALREAHYSLLLRLRAGAVGLRGNLRPAFRALLDVRIIASLGLAIMPVAGRGLAGGGGRRRRILLFDIDGRSGRLHRYAGVAVERRVVGRKVAECAKAIARIKAGTPASIDYMIVVMAPVVSMVPVVAAVMSPAIMIHSVILTIPSIIHPGVIATVPTIATVTIGK